MCNVFIITDDSNIVLSIKDILKDYLEFDCVGTSSNAVTATNFILKETPDVVFLDIDTVFEDPFEFVQNQNLFEKHAPIFIAVSSSKKKLYTIIKSGFFDFLLKPLSELEIRKTVIKLQKKIQKQYRKNICLKSYKDYQFLKTDEILYLKADNNTTDFYMDDGTIINGYKTLKTFEEILPNNFYRIHKSYIINKDFISRIQYGKSTCTIRKTNIEVPFTKTYISAIEKINKSLTAYSYISIK